jgi:Ca2+-binding RTX toxin-like protein
MRRATLLAVVVSVLLGAFAGVAYALSVQCDGAGDQDPDPGQCQGTEQSDTITGTDQRDLIFALGSFDDVFAGGGADELNGQNGGDFLIGEDNSDTYNGGNGSDLLGEEGNTGADVMNGGTDSDFIDAQVGADILRGQDGDECDGPFEVLMFGGQGNDKLYGGEGEDCMAGEAGTDEHFGGADNDLIDAADGDPETGEPLGTHDLVDCGGGVDVAIVNSDEDIVRANCENLVDVAPSATTRLAPPAGTTDEEQQQQKEAFIQEHGLQAPGS